MDSPGETLPSKRFALFTPPPEDPDFARVREHLVNTVTHAAIRLRRECVIANRVSFWDTVVDITSDPDRPNFVTVTARPIAVYDRPDATT